MRSWRSGLERAEPAHAHPRRRDAVYRAFAAHGIAFCAVSAPRLPEMFPPNQGLLLVRFSGRTRWYRHDYSRAELATWAERIRNSGAEEAWIYFNNDHEGHAIKNALVVRRMLRAITTPTREEALA